jgi:hypothetical protein
MYTLIAAIANVQHSTKYSHEKSADHIHHQIILFQSDITNLYTNPRAVYNIIPKLYTNIDKPQIVISKNIAYDGLAYKQR